MSCFFDVNVLVYASHAEDPRHPAARQLLEELVGGRENLSLAWATLTSYLRIITSPRVFARPLSPKSAEANASALFERPNARPLAEEEGFWEVFWEVTRGQVVRGKLVPDAHLAALLRQHGVKTLSPHDADFLRFPFLDVRDPFA